MSESKVKFKQGEDVLYVGLKGIFTGAYSSRPNGESVWVKLKDGRNISVNPKYLQKIPNNKKKEILKKVEAEISSSTWYQDDIFYLAQEYNTSVGKIYKCITKVMLDDYKKDGLFKDEHMKSEDVARLLAEKKKKSSSITSIPSIDFLETLPDEMIKEILFNLSPGNILNFCYTSKRLTNICRSPLFRKQYLEHSGGVFPKNMPIRDYMLNLGFPHNYYIGCWSGLRSFLYNYDHRIKGEYNSKTVRDNFRAVDEINILFRDLDASAKESTLSIKMSFYVFGMYTDEEEEIEGPSVKVSYNRTNEGEKEPSVKSRYAIGYDIGVTDDSHPYHIFSPTDQYIIDALKRVELYDLIKGETALNICSEFRNYDLYIKKEVISDFTNESMFYSKRIGIDSYHNHRSDKPWEDKIMTAGKA